MNISLNWLKDLVEIKKKPKDLADLLTLSGAEVESVKKKGDDYILDFDITANRGDELSVLGIAREIAALTNKKVKLSEPKIKKQTSDLPLDVEIDNPLICPRFSFRIIENIKVKPSPKWLVRRLKSYGFRPINNIVDITNYVMIELGQPLHAFDYDKVKGACMNIRRAKKGEQVTTLDGIPRALDEDAIIIEDKERLIDLAGIMGGQNSEVSEDTKTIILEAAQFSPVLIRRTSKRQSLESDASYRFERQIDPEGNIVALNRAAELIEECANGKIGDLRDIQKHKYTPTEIEVDYKKINKLLGEEIKQSASEKYLKRLGFEILESKENKAKVRVPSWRNEITIWQDLAEEVARMYGYANLKTKEPKKSKKDNTKTTYVQKELLKDILAAIGLSEVYSYSFLSDKDVEVFHCNPENLFEVENPVAPENRYLRDQLSPMLVKVVAKNPTFEEIDIFEIGQVFDKKKGKQIHLAVGLAGKETKSINQIILSINDKIGFDLKWKTQNLGEEELSRYKIKKKSVEIAETDLSSFLKRKPLKGSYQLIEDVFYRAISRFPSVTRDLAFVVEPKVNSEEVRKDIQGLSDLIKQVELFDQYVDIKLGEHKMSIAYHLQFQSSKRTLKNKEIDQLIKRIISKVSSKYKGKLRDF